MHAFDGQTDGQTVVNSKTVRMLRSRTVKIGLDLILTDYTLKQLHYFHVAYMIFNVSGLNCTLYTLHEDGKHNAWFAS